MTPTDQTKQQRRDRRLKHLGNLLYYGGVFIFPASLGAIAGFYAADQGVHWMPDMIGGVLAWCGFALVAIILGRWMKGRLHTFTDETWVVSRRVVVAAVLCVLAVTLRMSVYWMQQPSPLTELERAQFETAFQIDLEHYYEYERAMEAIIWRISTEPMFANGNTVLSPAEEELLLYEWARLYDLAFGMDQVRAFYEDWYRFDPSRAERPWHVRSFLLTYAAELALYEKSTRFSSLVLQNDDAKKYLDSPHPELGLDANTFSHFRQETLGSRDQARVLAGERYMEFLRVAMNGPELSHRLGVGNVWRGIRRHLRTIDRVAPIDRGVLTVRSEVQLLKRGVRRGWYPAQSAVAEWIGDTKTRRIGEYLIDAQQVAEMDPELEPGDIMLSRKNWYLSNVGLPGFWPHGLMYLGAPTKMRQYFADDPDVAAWVLEEMGEPMRFDQMLAERHPVDWAHYVAGEEGHPFRVIEAVSEGVIVNTLEHAAGDYLAALRPRVSKLTKAKAIAASFTYLGRPYDFDFDFATDHAVVCTELVWRAYRQAIPEVQEFIPLVEVAGRRTLPANDFVRIYDASRNTDAQILDFVLFYDARESEARAVREDDEEVFAKSWERVKWDRMQQ